MNDESREALQQAGFHIVPCSYCGQETVTAPRAGQIPNASCSDCP